MHDYWVKQQILAPQKSLLLQFCCNWFECNLTLSVVDWYAGNFVQFLNVSVLSFCGFIFFHKGYWIQWYFSCLYSTCSLNISGCSLSAELFSITMRAAVKICEPMHLPDTVAPNASVEMMIANWFLLKVPLVPLNELQTGSFVINVHIDCFSSVGVLISKKYLKWFKTSYYSKCYEFEIVWNWI